MTGSTTTAPTLASLLRKLQKLYHLSCHGSDEEGYALDYPSMNALLVEAVKQQQKQLKALAAKVEEAIEVML
jgi:hypothetical protein